MQQSTEKGSFLAPVLYLTRNHADGLSGAESRDLWCFALGWKDLADASSFGPGEGARFCLGKMWANCDKKKVLDWYQHLTVTYTEEENKKRDLLVVQKAIWMKPATKSQQA